MTAALLDRVHAVLNGTRRGRDTDGNPRYHADCPFCGKPAARGQNHFYYSALGYRCWVCGEGGGLVALARHLEVAIPQGYTPPARKAPPLPDTPRVVASAALLNAYAEPDVKFDYWRAYRGLKPRTVMRFRLGYGCFPRGHSWSRLPPRLMLPVLDEHGACITMRARAWSPDDVGPKWITWGRKYLYVPGGIRTGGVLWLVENCATALLIRQTFEEYDACAPTTGVASWDDRWVHRIAAARPDLVVIALDDDEAGHKWAPIRWRQFDAVGQRAEICYLTEADEQEMMRV